MLFCCPGITTHHLHAKDFWNTRKNEQTFTTSTFRIRFLTMRREKLPQKGEQNLLTGLEEVLEQLMVGITLAVKSDALYSIRNISL